MTAVDLPTFSVHQSTVVYENLKMIFDGMVVHREAVIEIDASKMRQEFLLNLMHHLSEGNIRVKMASKK